MRRSCLTCYSLHKVVLVNSGGGLGGKAGVGGAKDYEVHVARLCHEMTNGSVCPMLSYSSSCIFNLKVMIFGRMIILTPEGSETEVQVPGLMVVVVIITIMMMIVYHCIITTPLDCIKKSETKTYIIWVLRESSIFDQLSFFCQYFQTIFIRQS